jgi:hypothetical protein
MLSFGVLQPFVTIGDETRGELANLGRMNGHAAPAEQAIELPSHKAGR